MASADVKGERDAPAATPPRSPRFPVPARRALRQLVRALGPGRAPRSWARAAAVAAVAAGIRLPARVAPPGPTQPGRKRLPPPRSGSKLQGGDESPSQLFPGPNALGKSRLSAHDPTLQSPPRAARSLRGPHRRRRKRQPPILVTASGHGRLTAINNLWPAATPRGLASPWPGAWKYLFRKAPEYARRGAGGWWRRRP